MRYIICVDNVMEDPKVYDEFEVSFNFKNVLFICQVKLLKEAESNSYFNIDYFSPNEKGHIEHLTATPGKDGSEKTTWSEPTGKQEFDFLQTLGKAIEKQEM
jgi:hypothetical protein